MASPTAKPTQDQLNLAISGVVVGSTDEQTLTNKTLTSPKINEDVALTATSTELNLLDGKTVLNDQTGVYQNAIINGNFDIWQRGTSGFTSQLEYTADRWFHTFANSGEVSRESSIICDGSKYSLKKTGESDADEYCQLFTRLESRDGVKYFNQTGSFSVKIKGATDSGTITVGVTIWFPSVVDNFTTAESYTSSSPVTLDNTWQDIKLENIDFSGSTTSGYTCKNGIQIAIFFQQKTNTGNHTLYLSQAQLNLGSSALDFQPRHYAEELALCQMYFEKSYSINTDPGTVTDTGLLYTTKEFTSNTVLEWNPVIFKVSKRATPTIVYYAPDTGTANTIYDLTAAAENVVTNEVSASTESMGYLTVTDSIAVGRLIKAHWTADAEL